MNHFKELSQRAGHKCELCASTDGLSEYVVPPKNGDNIEDCLLVCASCLSQINGEAPLIPDHWRCLNEAIWSEHAAVKILAKIQLEALSGEAWAQDLLDSMYLDDDCQNWWTQLEEHREAIAKSMHVDCFGKQLHAGDTVTLIKDLDVKGSSLTAKRGTPVRNISLVDGNPEQIEGKVNGQKIVFLTKFVRKA